MHGAEEAWLRAIARLRSLAPSALRLTPDASQPLSPHADSDDARQQQTRQLRAALDEFATWSLRVIAREHDASASLRQGEARKRSLRVCAAMPDSLLVNANGGGVARLSLKLARFAPSGSNPFPFHCRLH